MTIVSNDVNKAIQILNNEDLVAIPTETVYGLAGSIFSENAIRKIFEMKQRPLFNPLIIHTYALDQLDKYVVHIPPKAILLAKAFWPGPLTLVLEKKSIVPDLITAGKKTVGIRIPNHPLTLELLEKLDFPLAAPSANPFGCISPTKPQHVEEYFKDTLAMVLDGGSCNKGIESTIIGFEKDQPVLYRLGSIALEDIVAVVGDIEIKNKEEKAPAAPGMIARHYAPKTPTFLVEDIPGFLQKNPNKKIGVITFNEKVDHPNIHILKVLSESGNLEEASARLYATMHTLDKLNLDVLVAQRFPEVGLGKTINDRLHRATQ